MKRKNVDFLHAYDDRLSIDEIIKRDNIGVENLDNWEDSLRESISECLV
jgi:hypothetical protein